MSIKSRFCAVCGNQKSKFIDSVCVDCYFKNVQVGLPKSITIQACPVCDAVNVKGFWIKAEETHEFYLMQAIIDKLKLPQEAELEDVDILQQGKEGRVEISLSIAGKRFSVVKPVELYIEDRTCDMDSKRKREAYEGVLQFRTDGNVHDFLSKVTKDAQSVSDNVLKVEELRNGADFYFLDIEPMRQLVSQLKKKIPLYIKESAKAYSWDKTKNKPKFRVTILARER